MTTETPERSFKRLVIAITLLLVLIPTLITGWLIGTSSGLHWLLTRALPAGTLQVGGIEGDLLRGLRITQLRYQEGETLVTLDELLFHWRPSALWHNELRAEMLYLQHLHIKLPPPATGGGPLQLPDIQLPVAIKLDDVQVNDLQIVRAGQAPIHINNASLRARTSRTGVKLQYLDISSDTAQLSLQGEFNPYGDYLHDLELQWQLQLPQGPTFNGSGRLRGDLHRTVLTHKLALPVAATATVTLTDLLQQLRWRAQLELPRQRLNALDPRLPNEPLALTARGSGDLNHASLDHFTLGTAGGQLQGSGALDWRDKFFWQASVESRAFDLADLWSILNVSGAPQIKLAARLKLRGDLDHLEADTIALNGLNGTLKGSGALHWRERLKWHGTFQAEGIELAQLWPLIHADKQGLPAGRADIAATLSGDDKGLRFKELAVTALDAALSGRGQLRWSPQLEWQAELNGEGIDPARWQPQRLAGWSGTLATHLQSSGRYTSGALQGDLDIKETSGTLRGYPFELQSQLALDGDEVKIGLFRLHSADSRIEAHGQISDEIDLKLQLDSPQLAQLYPATQGSLSVAGELRGPKSAPLLQLQLNGKGLAYDEQRIGALSGRAEFRLFSWQKMVLDLQARELQLAGQSISAVEISSRGETGNHQMQLHMKLAQLETQWRLEGGYDLDHHRWRGRITQADIDHPDLGMWQLKNAVAFDIDPARLQLEPLCWQHQLAQLCLQGQHQGDEWRASVQAQQFALALFNPWLPREMELKGEATLAASLRYRPQQPLAAKVQFNVGAGSVSYTLIEGERSEWHFEKGEWQATLDKHGLRTKLQLALEGKDRIDATLRLDGYDPLRDKIGDQPLKGEINASFGDIGLLSNLFYEVQGLQGRIELSSRIGGTPLHPSLKGQLQLRDGSFQIPRLGLKLTGLEFDALSNNSEQVSYRLTVHSGDGAIEANGETRLDPEEGWPTTIALKGENFMASRIPEARVVINPNLTMKMARREIWLDGEVMVPQARIEPKELTMATHVSDDVVIVGAPQPLLPPWQIHSRVRLVLGDRVSLYGFGFEGTIGGNLLLIDEPGKVTSASGELSVIKGRYSALGKKLDIEQGRLLFAGGPVTKPGLELRAVRQNLPPDITAGIKVKGTLDRPQLELFSVPAMDQQEILSYIIFGTSIDQISSGEQGALLAQAALALGLKGGDLLARTIGNRFGIDEMRIETGASSTGGEQASLLMGTYLSPRLYVGYGVGLIDAVNTLNLRYQIADHWQLKAESGISQGADLTYTIDR